MLYTYNNLTIKSQKCLKQNIQVNTNKEKDSWTPKGRGHVDTLREISDR